MAKRAKPAKRERGSYLTWVLVVIMIGAVLRGAQVMAGWVPSDMGVKTSATAATYADGVLAMFAFLGGYAAWYWKRWGAYLLYATAVAYGVAHVEYDELSPTTALVVVAVVCAVLYTATRSAWGETTDSKQRRKRKRKREREQTCPECDAINTGTALRCDCGYNFLRRRMERECPRCRRFVPEDASECPCGQHL